VDININSNSDVTNSDCESDVNDDKSSNESQEDEELQGENFFNFKNLNNYHYIKIT